MIKAKRLFLIFVAISALSLQYCVHPITAYADNAPSEIVIEHSTGRVLMESNSSSRRSIASLTKIMTAIIAIENTDISSDFKVSKDCVGVEGSSIYLKQGDVFTIEDLLYGLMLRSGNDAATAISIATAGSTKRFVQMMNEKARKLNLKNTNFTNPHGLHDDGHYSSAHDVALMLSYAMNNDVYCRIVKAREHVATEKSTGKQIKFYNKNKLLQRYEYSTGGKTGYTKISGRCLASSAQKNSMSLICVVLGHYDTYGRTQASFEDSFSNFRMKTLCSSNEFKHVFHLKKAKTPCEGYVKKSFSYPIKNEEDNKIRTEIFIDNNLKPPLKKDEKIGRMEIYLEKQLLFSQNIYTIIDVKKIFDIKDPIDYWI